jgi:membrane associated rhomboid family serine protease
MAGSPELFVVCKNCRAEVSPYITECPYCGHRLRKRAPKLDKGAVPRRERRGARSAGPVLGRLRPGELPGVRVEGRPVVTWALVLVPALLTVLLVAGVTDLSSLALVGPVGNDWWRPFTTTLLYPAFDFGGTAYEVVTLGAVFLFGWLLERRHGHWAPLVVFVLGTAAGMWLVVTVDPSPYAFGANAGALALLGAWVVRDLLALQRQQDIDGDLLGVLAIAVVLALLPAAVDEAHWLAGAAGLIAGLLMGLVLARVPER